MKKIKPLGQKSYGSIPHMIGSRMGPADKHCEPGQQDICTKKARDYKDLIIVQEKLDGSNCSVAKINGEIYALGRSGYLAESSPFEQHIYFAEWVKKYKLRFKALLNEGERICGEWLLQAHSTRYNLHHEPFVVFDIMRGHDRLIYHSFLKRVLPKGFIIPRLIHIGQPIKLEKVLSKLEPSGHGAIDMVEGCVYRCERDNKVDFLIKYVRPDKEDGIYLPERSDKPIIWNINPVFYDLH